jgi:hypothetical protein
MCPQVGGEGISAEPADETWVGGVSRSGGVGGGWGGTNDKSEKWPTWNAAIDGGRSQVVTYAHVCARMLTYAHVCSRMLTYADIC